VEFGYGGAFRLAGASFEVAEGEIMGLVGPNSSGKTTLLRLLSKVHAPDRGEIHFRGRPLGTVARLDLARDVAVVPQEEQLAFPGERGRARADGTPSRGARAGSSRARRTSPARARPWPSPACSIFGDHLSTRWPAESASARCSRARSPRSRGCSCWTSRRATSNLLHQRHLVGLLRQLNRERGMTVIFVSHDLNLAGELADRLLLLSGGRVVRLGPPREVLDEAVLEQAYGCPVWVERLASGRPVVLGVRL
jgi:iron complex transport system ATP-binding protein